MGFLIYKFILLVKFIKKNILIYNTIYESEQTFYRGNNRSDCMLFDLYLFCINFNTVCTSFFSIYLKSNFFENKHRNISESQDT